jgi:hypothetical protein
LRIWIRIQIQIQFRIQGFDDQKFKKCTAKIKLFLQKLKLLFPRPQDVQDTGEVFITLKRISSTSKLEIYFTFVGHFCPPDPDPEPANQNESGSMRIGIRIHNIDENKLTLHKQTIPW